MSTGNQKTLIYLAALANDKFGVSPATVPLECGFIKAYAMEQFPDDLEIEIFRTFRELYDAVEERKPDIIGCAWYGWNLWLTTNAFAYIKAKYPDIMTVVGGANVPDHDKDILRDLKQYPQIDIIIPNEGEIPFVNLLKVYLEGGADKVFNSVIDGVYYLNKAKNALVTGLPVPLPKDVNIFPSPYLKGYLDRFLKTDLMPIIQTTRGCPFHCTFCVAAKDAWNKVRAFDVERVKEEIRYLDKRARNRTLRLTDENFGIIQRDLDVAQFIYDYREQTSYPSAVRAYTHKNINDRVKSMALLLKELIPLNVSFQSMTPSVLDNIKRKNIGVDNFGDLVNWAHQHGLVVTTEIIFGLPGETYSSFMEGINRLVAFRLDSVGGGALMMLKEAPLSRQEAIDQYGYVTKYGIAESGFTEYKDFRSVEIEGWAVSNKYFTYDEYMKFRLFSMFYGLFMFRGFFKELIYVCDERGVKIVDIVEELLDHPATYTFFAARVERLRENLEGSLYASADDVRAEVDKRQDEITGTDGHYDYMNAYELSDVIHGELIHSTNLDTTCDEVIKACLTVFDRHALPNKDLFVKELNFCKTLMPFIVAPYWKAPEEVVSIESYYDLVSWSKKDYRGFLSDYALEAPKRFFYKINSVNQYLDLQREHHDSPFERRSKIFFESFKSQNIRRFLMVDHVENIPTPSLAHIAGDWS